MSIRSVTAQALFRINPYWDEIPWNRERDRELRRTGLTPKKSKKINTFQVRPVHVIVVPQHGPSDSRFVPGTRNFYFESAERLRELLGDKAVSVLDVRENDPPEDWHAKLIELVRTTSATHVLTHIEIDAGNQLSSWTWDQVFIQLLNEGWDGALLGVNFDSAFKWIRAKSRRLARISPQFLAIDICTTLTGELVKGRIEVGPVNMPLSMESLKLVASAIEGEKKTHDISFFGALYPYRVELIDSLRIRGINVAVNPHRSDTTTDFESSSTNQPSWLDYMRGLASSHMTINFSQSSAGPFEQLKTRVIEATLAGTFLLTDDQDRTRLFFSPDQFETFKSVDDLPNLIEKLLSDREALSARARDAQVRAQELAVSNFWSEIDKGLRQRGLPTIFD